jgi:YHS domain-containing protein
MNSRGQSRVIYGGAILAIAVWTHHLWAGDPPQANSGNTLNSFRDFVGEWRGVGQIRRGSTRGAWQEDLEWLYSFEGDVPALLAQSDDSRWMGQARVMAASTPGEFRLELIVPDESRTRIFSGESDADGVLVFEADEPAQGDPDRISLRLVAGGDRLIVLYEALGAGERYTRLGEVGFTRRGASFGKSTYPECIVTGGRGTILVDYEGKSYYVCCGGCRDLFLESPEKILEAYRSKNAESKDSAEKAK